MSKDTRPRPSAAKTNDVPPMQPLPANPPPIMPTPMPFDESPRVPQTRPPADPDASKVSRRIAPSKGSR